MKLDILKDDDCLVDNYISAERRERKFEDLEEAVEGLSEELGRLVKMKIWEGMLRSNVQIRILYLIMAAAQDTLSLLKIWC